MKTNDHLTRLIALTRYYEKALCRHHPTRRHCIKSAAFCLRYGPGR